MFPSNFLFNFPHAGYLVPPELDRNIAPYMHDSWDRLLKNFSDWATKYLLDESVPTENFVLAKWSRAIGDLNRAKTAPDIFRDTDFWDIPLWKNPLTQEQKENSLKQYYDIFHDEVDKKLQNLLQQHDTVYLIDVHDTGSLYLGKTQKEDYPKPQPFPEIALCNCLGETCDNDTLEIFWSVLKQNFGYQIQYNNPYKYSFTIDYYTKKYPNIIWIQVEFGRYLLLDETTQEIHKNIDQVKKNWWQSISDFSNKLAS